MELRSLRELMGFVDVQTFKNILLRYDIEPLTDDGFEIRNRYYHEMVKNTLFEKIINCIDQTSLDLIEKVAEFNTSKPDQDSLKAYYDVFCDYGIFYMIENEYAIPSEIYENIQKNRLNILVEKKNNDLVFHFAKAAVSYYGLLNREEILEVYNLYHPYKTIDIFPKLAFFNRIQTTFSYNGEYLYDNNVKNTSQFVNDREHFNFLPFYKYTLEQFYVDERFLSIDVDFDFYQELVDYFTLEIKCDASIIVAIYYFLMYEYDIQKLREAIEQETVIDVALLDERFNRYVKKLYTYVRCWVLKGHMVSELNDQIQSNPKLYIESPFVLLKKGETTKRYFNR